MIHKIWYEPRTTRLILLLVAMGLVAANGIWLLPALREVDDNASRLRVEVAGRTADSVTNFVEGKLGALRQTAEVLRFDRAGSRSILWRLLKEQPEFSTVSLLDAEFKERLQVSRLYVPTPGELRNYVGHGGLRTDIWEEGISRGPVKRNENLEPTMFLAVPVIFGAGEERGVLLADLNLKALSAVVSQFRFGASGKVYLIDRAGNLIIDPDISLVLRRIEIKDRPVVAALMRGEQVERALHRNEQGAAVIASGIFLKELEWGVVSEQDAGEVYALRNRIILLALLSSGAGILLLFLLFFNSLKLARLNINLQELLHENYESAKMLVRRDRELVFTNTRLRELLMELEEVGKMLVRRDLELTRANARLEELDKMKSEFVSIAAHQLRTPLTGIRWSYQTLLDRDSGALAPAERRLLQSGLGATLRMIELVNDLLSVARIEEGRFGIHLRKQSILPVLETLAARIAALAKDKAVAFSFQRYTSALPDLMFDEDKITLALDNFLDNALKYTEPGGRIGLSVSRDRTHVRIEVTDTGIGIPAGQLHRVFTKFFRADNAIRLHTSGTGLGLYVAKNIIEKHDGAVEVKSAEGKGSTFSLTLPVV